jgi:4-amino-4-deoxy-L-arabinose transferase-like glycosyltransferase
MVTTLGQRVASRTAPFERYLALIALAALALRIVYILAAQIHEPGVGDALYYSRQADRIAGGGFFDDPANPGHPAADHPPLTALLLTPGSFFPGVGLPYHRFTMALLGVAAVVVIGWLGRRVGGDRVGLVAAGIAAIYPNLWMNDALAMSETPATLMAALILLALYRFIDRPTVTSAAWVGLACGVGILARAELALFLPVVMVPIALWARSLPLVARLGRIAVAGLVTGAVLLPWTAFNLARFENPVALSTNDGLTIIGANCEEVYNTTAIGLWSLQCAQRVPATGDQSEISAVYRDAGVDFIRANRSRLPAVVATRVARVWSFYAPDQMAWYNQGEGRPRWASYLGLGAYYLLLAGAVGGTVILRRRRTPVWPLASTAIIVTVTAAAFYGLVRFRVPAEVAIVVLAAVTIDALLRRRSAATTTAPT